jgi:hypothetical protein
MTTEQTNALRIFENKIPRRRTPNNENKEVKNILEGEDGVKLIKNKVTLKECETKECQNKLQ